MAAAMVPVVAVVAGVAVVAVRTAKVEGCAARLGLQQECRAAGHCLLAAVNPLLIALPTDVAVAGQSSQCLIQLPDEEMAIGNRGGTTTELCLLSFGSPATSHSPTRDSGEVGRT